MLKLIIQIHLSDFKTTHSKEDLHGRESFKKLRYIWIITLCKFKVYNVTIWCIYILQYEDHSQFSSVQSLSRVSLFATPWITAHQASLSITNSWSSLKLISIESVMPSAISSSVVLFSSCPQSLPASESFPMSQLFAWGGQSTGVSVLVSFQIPGLISFRMDWLDLLAVQGTLLIQ